jgi:5'-methylthioadenosine phosphorylase
MKIGVIGGSGVYELEGLQNGFTRAVETPFGAPSDTFVGGLVHGVEVFFLPRHGRGHRLLPAEINHRANIYAFKSLGVERVISISAVGSLKAELRPRDVVLPDQYFDRTKRSLEHTFFGQGLVAHVAFGEPTCPELRGILASVARQVAGRSPETSDRRIQDGGTYVNMEGPAFSTKAESQTYRKMGFDVIGMTSLGEAKLCREAEICYQSLAMVTDYDCWHESEAPVTVEMVIGHLVANTRLGKDILVEALRRISTERGCSCGGALANSILTDRKAIPEETRKRLAPIVGKYV